MAMHGHAKVKGMSWKCPWTWDRTRKGGVKTGMKGGGLEREVGICGSVGVRGMCMGMGMGFHEREWICMDESLEREMSLHGN